MKMQELAERVVRAEGWRWMRRMLTLNHGTVVSVRGNGVPQTLECGTAQPDNPLPNLSDPATLGCLLALVREKHGALVYVRQDFEPFDNAGDEDGIEGWEVRRHMVYGSHLLGAGDTEAEALVAAPEAAP